MDDGSHLADDPTDHPVRSRRYSDEDLTPTSALELRGWYSYGMAAEVFAVCGVGSFLPVTLEQLARENGVLWSDRSVPCFKPTSPDSLANSEDGGATRLARLARRVLLEIFDRRSVDGREADQCVVRVFGADVTTASFAMYTFSAAVFVQALVLVSFGSFADHGDNRKRLLLGFGLTGAVVCMSFVLVVPSLYLIAPFLVIIAVTCLGSSFVLLNSFLPLLAANHHTVQQESNRENSLGKARESAGSIELQLSNKISSKGVGIGYAAAVFVQCLSILVLFMMNKVMPSTSSKTLPLRCVLLLAGAWWFAFTLPAAKWLRNRPGPPLQNIQDKGGVYKYIGYIGYAWKSLWQTIKVAVKLKQAAVFLLAWFLLSDAVATVSGTAILFARTELKLGTVAVALLSITATASGIAGSIVWPMLSKRFGWQTNKTIVSCMILMEIIPIYGLMGYLPFIKSIGFGGLQQSWEIYPLGVVHGIVMGGLSSYCRSFFGRLIPPGHEVAFYALFAITDKGSSAIGPAIVGRIVDVTGRIRPAFAFLAVLIALPMPLVWYVDAEAGQRDAIVMAKKMQPFRGGGNFEMRENEHEEAEALMTRSE